MKKYAIKTQKDKLRHKCYACALTTLLVCISLLAFTNVGVKHLKYKSAEIISKPDRNFELKMKIYEKEKSFEEPKYGNPLYHLFLVLLKLDT